MSEKGKKTKTRASPAAEKPSWRAGKALKILSFLLGLIVIIIILAAALLWFNRISVIRHYVDKTLQSYGIEADYKIKTLTRSEAILTDISVSQNETPLFTAKALEARYTWREAMNGQFQSLDISGAKTEIHINEGGRLKLPWQGTGGGPSGIAQALPRGGVRLDGASVRFISPYGDFDAAIEAAMSTLREFEADISIAPTKLSYQGYALEGLGTFTVMKDNGPAAIEGQFSLDSVTGNGTQIDETVIIARFQPQQTDGVWTLSGTARTGFSRLQTPELIARDGTLDWEGQLEVMAGETLPAVATGNWSVSAREAGLANEERRQNFARRLSLAEPLANAPVAQNFAPVLTAHMQQLMATSTISASGRLTLGPEETELSLSAPAILTGKTSSLTLEQTDWAPLYRYDKALSEVRLAFHAEMTEPAGLKMRETEIVASSGNGWRFDAVNRFRADVQTRRTWRRNLGTIFGQNRKARISPFRADVVYEHRPQNRFLTLKGAIDFDGPVPGGFANGLKSAGRLDLSFDEPVLTMTYQPDNHDPVTLTRFDTDTAWRAEDIELTLLSRKPVFKRRGQRAMIDAELGQLSFNAIDETGTRHLDMTFNHMDAQGILTGQNDNQAQQWALQGTGAKIRSEDTPGPGTEIQMAEMDMTVSRQGKEAPQFVLTSPRADARTSLVDARGLTIQVKGRPDQYRLDYQNGDVKFSAEALPRLPMSGYVDYARGVFSGEAGTYLPRTRQTPIDIDYRFENGIGSAAVDIPALAFTRSGLQPQDLIPALRGKIADVNGDVSARINLSFTAGSPVRSEGTADISLATLGTLPGPMADVKTTLGFSSFFPLQSRGFHSMTIGSFDPGLPLSNGVVDYALIPDGVQIRSARWPIGGGYISMRPMSWLYSAAENRVTLDVENVSVGAFVDRDFGDGQLKVTGIVNGAIPITLSGISVTAEDGLLEVKDGGTIQYVSAQTNEAGQANEYSGLAVKALENLDYKSLEARFNGPLDGKLDVRLVFEGKNDDVWNGQPFHFDINLEGQLMKLLRDLDPGSYVDRLRANGDN